MASYKVVLKPSVEKDVRSLPKSLITRVLRQIEVLRDDPFSRTSVQLEDGEGLRRIRSVITVWFTALRKQKRSF